MTELLKEPPVVSGDPPELPPYLQRRRRGNGPLRIMPSPWHAAICDRTQWDNCWTLHYRWMVRYHLEEGLMEGPVHVNTRIYRRWLETYEFENDIPPHVRFGGAVDPLGEPDPEFFNKWVKYAQEMFC